MAELKDSLKDHKVDMSIEYSLTLHDREIRYTYRNHTKINVGCINWGMHGEHLVYTVIQESQLLSVEFKVQIIGDIKGVFS